MTPEKKKKKGGEKETKNCVGRIVQAERRGRKNLPVLDDFERTMRHTVDAPFHISVFIADRDRKSTKIGTNQIDVCARLTLNFK